MDKILKWCGLNNQHDMVEYGLGDASRDWCRKCGCNGDEVGGECEPTLDMNFFIKYVKEPFILKYGTVKYRTFLEDWVHEITVMSKDPNQAWQEALLKLIEVKP